MINSIFGMYMESWILRVSCKVNVKPFGLHLLCTRPEVFMIPWKFQKLNSFLKWMTWIAFGLESLSSVLMEIEHRPYNVYFPILFSPVLFASGPFKMHFNIMYDCVVFSWVTYEKSYVITGPGCLWSTMFKFRAFYTMYPLWHSQWKLKQQKTHSAIVFVNLQRRVL